MSEILVSIQETPIDVTVDESGNISAKLSPTTVVVESSTTGPQGGAGVQGLTGVQGFGGIQGFDGAQGIQGTDGIQGSLGLHLDS